MRSRSISRTLSADGAVAVGAVVCGALPADWAAGADVEKGVHPGTAAKGEASAWTVGAAPAGGAPGPCPPEAPGSTLASSRAFAGPACGRRRPRRRRSSLPASLRIRAPKTAPAVAGPTPPPAAIRSWRRMGAESPGRRRTGSPPTRRRRSRRRRPRPGVGGQCGGRLSCRPGRRERSRRRRNGRRSRNAAGRRRRAGRDAFDRARESGRGEIRSLGCQLRAGRSRRRRRRRACRRRARAGAAAGAGRRDAAGGWRGRPGAVLGARPCRGGGGGRRDCERGQRAADQRRAQIGRRPRRGRLGLTIRGVFAVVVGRSGLAFAGGQGVEGCGKTMRPACGRSGGRGCRRRGQSRREYGGDHGHGAPTPLATPRLAVRRNASSALAIVARGPSALASPGSAADSGDGGGRRAQLRRHVPRRGEKRRVGRVEPCGGDGLEVAGGRVVAVRENPPGVEIEAGARLLGTAGRRGAQGFAGRGCGGVEPPVQRRRAGEGQQKVPPSVSRPGGPPPPTRDGSSPDRRRARCARSTARGRGRSPARTETPRKRSAYCRVSSATRGASRASASSAISRLRAASSTRPPGATRRAQSRSATAAFGSRRVFTTERAKATVPASRTSSATRSSGAEELERVGFVVGDVGERAARERPLGSGERVALDERDHGSERAAAQHIDDERVGFAPAQPRSRASRAAIASAIAFSSAVSAG